MFAEKFKELKFCDEIKSTYFKKQCLDSL
jgi:hypothetical protein